MTSVGNIARNIRHEEFWEHRDDARGFPPSLLGFHTHLSASLSFQASEEHILKSTWPGALFPLHSDVGGRFGCLLASPFLHSSEKVIKSEPRVLDTLAWGGNPGFYCLPRYWRGILQLPPTSLPPSLIHTPLVLPESPRPRVGFQLLTRLWSKFPGASCYGLIPQRANPSVDVPPTSSVPSASFSLALPLSQPCWGLSAGTVATSDLS